MKKRILLFAVSLIFVLGFTACGKAKQSAEELIQQENEIIAEHQDLWDLAFNAVDGGVVFDEELTVALSGIRAGFPLRAAARHGIQREDFLRNGIDELQRRFRL